jgi:hypothetical protein
VVGWLEVAIFFIGGRLALIKSTLSNFPTCYLSLFLFELVWLIGLRNFSNIFLHKGINEEFKFYLVKWSKICSLKQAGGLWGMKLDQV